MAVIEVSRLLCRPHNGVLERVLYVNYAKLLMGFVVRSQHT